MIDRCKGVLLANTIIEDSFQGSEQSGGAVDVRNSRDVSITNCQILDFKFRGIALTDSVRSRVTGCSVIERRQAPQKGTSIVVKGGKDNLIANNIVNPAGLAIDSPTAKVRDNIEAAGTN